MNRIVTPLLCMAALAVAACTSSTVRVSVNEGFQGDTASDAGVSPEIDLNAPLMEAPAAFDAAAPNELTIDLDGGESVSVVPQASTDGTESAAPVVEMVAPPELPASGTEPAPVVSLGGVSTTEPTPTLPVSPELPVAPEEADVPTIDLDGTGPTATAPEAPATPAAPAATPPGATSPDARTAMAAATQLYNAGSLRAARTAYTRILDLQLSAEDEASVIAVLGAINGRIFMSTGADGDLRTYTVVNGDSLSRIAREYNTTWQTLRRINGLDSNLIRVGQVIKVPRTSFTVLVRKDKFVADLLIGGDFVKRYTVGLGKNGSTPVGEFTIRDRIEKPADKGVKFGEPGHRLGTHWLGIEGANGYQGYGFHGCPVSEYSALGTECSEGCVRMTNEDAGELHDLLPVGTKITIRR